MQVLDTSNVAIQNLTEVIDSVQSWVDEMKTYLPNGNVINADYNEIH